MTTTSLMCPKMSKKGFCSSWSRIPINPRSLMALLHQGMDVRCCKELCIVDAAAVKWPHNTKLPHLKKGKAHGRTLCMFVTDTASWARRCTKDV